MMDKLLYTLLGSAISLLFLLAKYLLDRQAKKSDQLETSAVDARVGSVELRMRLDQLEAKLSALHGIDHDLAQLRSIRDDLDSQIARVEQFSEMERRIERVEARMREVQEQRRDDARWIQAEVAKVADKLDRFDESQQQMLKEIGAISGELRAMRRESGSDTQNPHRG